MKSVLNQTVLELKGVMADIVAPWQGLRTVPTAENSDDVSQRILLQQLRKLVCQPPSSVLEPALGSAIWLAALWWIAPGFMAAIYTLLIAGILGSTYLVLRQCARHDPSDAELLVRGAQRGRRAVSSGLLWGSVGFSFPHLVQPFGSFVAIGQLMVIAAALSLSVTYRPAISWLAVPCAALTSASLIIHGAGLNIAVGVGFAVVVVMMRMARLQNTLITRSMQAAEERVEILAELHKQRIAAQEATEAKTRFLAGVSHDLRQPMHSIALLAETFQQQDDPKGMVSRQISASVHAMDDMLSALLEVSRLDDGALPLDVGPVAVDAMFQRIQMQFSAQAQAKGIDLSVWPCGLRVLTDAYQLQRMLANLTSNAVRYTTTGRIFIRGRSRGSTLWLQVWDSGLGIAVGHRQRIFEEFFQVERRTRSTTEGMGLGLSLVRRAAERLGHRVIVRSRFGKGSMFAIGVPIVQGQEHRKDANNGEISLQELLGTRLVLLIEDDAAVRQGMLMLLRSFNCHVMEAYSSQTALSLVDSTLRTPDVIISDYHLGNSDTGIDAITKVREAVDEDIPAVLITAQRNAPRDAAARLGIPVLTKPLQPRDLASALCDVLADLPHRIPRADESKKNDPLAGQNLH